MISLLEFSMDHLITAISRLKPDIIIDTIGSVNIWSDKLMCKIKPVLLIGSPSTLFPELLLLILIDFRAPRMIQLFVSKRVLTTNPTRSASIFTHNSVCLLMSSPRYFKKWGISSQFEIDVNTQKLSCFEIYYQFILSVTVFHLTCLGHFSI